MHPNQFQQIRNSQSSQSESQQLASVIHQLQYFPINIRSLSSNIQTNPYQPFQQLKQYITLYVQHHNQSQELFNLMCQHNMLAKLFTRVSKPIFVLETFNLLLANTHQIPQLVYIFSHPLFHNYLLIGFENIVPLSAGMNSNSNYQQSKINAHQCIEYYVQLLKTLVMKLQAQINECTLLKLFCNSKYSYFPLLTNCILLAIKRNIKEQLVRITAQHCILQLIGIMARKKVGEYYFSNIHMVVFYYEITTEMIEEETTKSSNQDTTIKYVLDLLKAITHSQSVQMKEKAFLLFFNIFSNSLTFKFFKNPAPALHLLLKLSSSFSEVQQLQYLSAKYLAPIYFILGKLIFNKYLNNVTLSSIILVSESILELSEMKDVNLLKIIKTYYEKNPLSFNDIEINRNSFKQQPKHRHAPIFSSNNKYKNSMISIEQNILFDKYTNVLKEIDNYNLNNAEFFQLKQNYYKKSTSSPTWLSNIGSLFRKINVFDIVSAQYIKKIMQIASIRYTHQHQFSYLQQVFAPTSVYLYQFFKLKNKEKYIFGQKTEDTQKIEISFNQNRDQFLAQIQFFKVVLNIAEVAFIDIDMLHGLRREVIQKLQQQYNPRLINPGEVYFTLHFRQYFQHSMFEFICTSESIKHRTQITPKLLNYVYKICSQLQLLITQNNRNKILSEISKLQNQLFSTIQQKGFEDFLQYIDSEKEKKMVIQNQNKMQTSIFRFENQQEKGSSRNSLSSSKKKKSIFGNFRSSSNDSSPIKDSDRFSIKESSLSKQIECKMLHLQLLRFILSQSLSSGILFNNYIQQQAKPLHKIYESNFVSYYKGYQKSLYELKGVRFNSELDCECVLKIKPKIDDLTVVVELYHKDKLILKCNALDFTLSQLKLDPGSSHPVGVDEQQNQKVTAYVTILPTANNLGFNEKEKAQELLNTLNAIKQEYRKLKQNSILQYLNKRNQDQQFKSQ